MTVPTRVLQVTTALSRAVAYLEGQLLTVGNNTYTACIVAYALTLAGSDKAQDARDKMEALAVTAGTLLFVFAVDLNSVTYNI